MGQIEDLRIFVDIVNAGGIARAAEGKSIAKSALSRRLKLLEERLGIQLVDRRPGQWEVTTAGQELYQRALRLLSEAEEIDADFSHSRQSLSGPLSVSLPREFGLAFLQPILLRFAQEHPDIQLTLDFEDRQVDLERENYDLAIRISAQTSPDLVSTRLGSAGHQLFASPNYADRRPLPRTVSDLKTHALLHYGTGRKATWVFETDSGKETLQFQPVLNSNSGHFLLAAAKSAQGIVRLPDFIAAEACRSGVLIPVLPEARLTDWNLSIAYSKNRLINRRMRRFITAISEACLGL